MGDVDVYMPLFPADYLADTMDLTTEEHGAYLLLMMALWRSEGSIHFDHSRLATTTRVSPRHWPAIWAAISRFFVVRDGMLSQGRVLREIDNAKKKRQAAIENGRRGGLAKARVARLSLGVGQDAADSETLANRSADSTSSSSSPGDLCVSPPAPARDPGTPGAQSAAVTGPYLTTTFGEVRSKVFPGTLPWVGTPTAPEKAASMAASIGPEMAADIAPTMLLLLTRAKAGEHERSADIAKAPAFGFACWCNSFVELREEMHGRAPAIPPNATRKPAARDVRYGHARAEDFKHTHTGEVKI